MEYIINGQKYDTNSITNQKILDNVVDKNVHACVNDLVEYIINSAPYKMHVNPPFTDEDVENGYEYICPECGQVIEYNNKENDKEIICSNCNAQIDDIWDCDSCRKEVFQWFIVDRWFAEQLREQNEVIIDTPNNYIWGRTSFGQMIAIDRVIQRIALDMKVLEGQDYSWADKL